ncbi:MAG: DNA recombination protein RmuC, partial [Phycisphaerae bacterium]
RELFERVRKFSEHLARVGDGLRKSTEAYNAALGSWERRITPSGRRLAELGAVSSDQELPAPIRVEERIRALPVEAEDDTASRAAG